ncbi:bacillithiol system redox-active protein YtxJ [Litoribacter ruber]|uniref:Bacillithiol system redox-active protein YtxJ n=1 Tax=Litoribacter ruber TaxID=702568 RepID=A0AAP2CFL1_9BACT|nr:MULTISPECIES: bacillithiol system redox-active protein YtxJ [Litoribacter]MBS9523683.1 bacillithiol system redox-active protein YtxJ [Litoribacter alkaliphilus]MBT0812197.1 bacillithiol system redox-active protein YtxJ [Litoribacter ruber]
MNWTNLENTTQLEDIKKESHSQPIMIFKHSTRCSISGMAIDRLTRSWKESETSHIKPYYLDLISYRQISNQIAEEFGVQHESPQVILVKDGKAVYDTSHMGINYKEILSESSSL